MPPDPTPLAARPLHDLVRRVEPLRAGDLLAEAAGRIAAAEGGLPVADAAGRLVGFLTEQDVLRALVPAYITELPSAGMITRDFPALVRGARRAADRPVADVMSTDPPHLTADDSEAHAAELFLRHGVRTLPVVSGDRVVGILRLADVVDSLLIACGRGPAERRA